tara:strand:+ start:247 stop:813 length:567 start_codon:yes stop_codon:yes gene_type:complete
VKKKIIAIIGPDGSGKSSIIIKITKKLRKYKINYKQFHLKPSFFPTKNIVVKNPHDQIYRSEIFSLFKLIYWIILFRVYFLINFFDHKKIYIFDRYPDDILIDDIRYRFKLNKTITKNLLNLLPRPNLWINMTGKPKIIWERKKEINLITLTKLLKKYHNFLKDYNNHINVTNFKKIDKIYENIISKL